MTPDDRDAFAGHLTVLAETFGEPLPLARLEGYFLALRDLLLVSVQAAVETALGTCTFFPRPAELRALAGAAAPSVGLVESLLVLHLRETGGERRHPADPFLALVVDRLGGIRSVAGMDSATRLAFLGKLVSSLVEAARVRGVPMPTESMTPLPPIVQRSMGRGAPVTQITHEATTIRHVNGPQSVGGILAQVKLGGAA